MQSQHHGIGFGWTPNQTPQLRQQKTILERQKAKDYYMYKKIFRYFLPKLMWYNSIIPKVSKNMQVSLK